VHQFYGKAEGISADAIREISGGVPDTTIEGLWAAIKSQAFANLQVRACVRACACAWVGGCCSHLNAANLLSWLGFARSVS
jgi:tRNA U38,U39,U40 pseudouridine synthase TruA